ncbi:SMI1/KNR4 family protein [Actinoallomurus purpureus]|uniref:SMI1/KNR4 family protein n=1 Tax=Actinoallomurus purpureus TaxID=478114 RepID=UPI0020925510|nr:SMI1/KNR4 family protein [Actinoallomurus purpureus]MCO6010544.1 SMI1/KNR4 family protein [Actinoallomurus purpureus]
MDITPFHRAWARFSGWLAEHAPDDHAVLRPAATEEQIAAIETAYGVELHPELTALLRLHDGTPWDVSRPSFGCFLPIGHRLSGTDQIISMRQILLDFHEDFPENWGDWRDIWTDEPVIARSHRWVPFAEPNDGGLAFVDHCPGPTYGHVYEFGMGSGASDVTLWGTSLTEFFDAMATAVETGAPFQNSYPTFRELRRDHFPAYHPLVGRRFFDWNPTPDATTHDSEFVVHRVTASRKA